LTVLSLKEFHRFTSIINHAGSLLLLETFREEMVVRRGDRKKSVLSRRLALSDLVLPVRLHPVLFRGTTALGSKG
jgi:hypothetical protein